MTPIGIYHSTQVHPYEVGRQPREDRANQGVIELNPKQGFEQALEGLSGFDRIWVIFQFHHNTHWKPMVRPPRGADKKIGVFATRAPYRPNPLGLSNLRLVKIEGLKLFVEGADLLDQTPILDLKPYLAEIDSFPEAKAGWLERVEELRHRLEWSEEALDQRAWLEDQGVENLRAFTEQQLEFHPFDSDRKRVKILAEGKAELSYRTWRIHFQQTAPQVLKVTQISSGYSSEDLKSPDDPHRDKSLHRFFLERWIRSQTSD